jgi:hypothetical protein
MRAGKITSVEPVSGDSGIASAIAKRIDLVKSIGSAWPKAPQVGIVVANLRNWQTRVTSPQNLQPRL